MKQPDDIAYYCVNRNCGVSVYRQSAVLAMVLPLTFETLAKNHLCLLCKSTLVSLIDLEVQKSVRSYHAH